MCVIARYVHLLQHFQSLLLQNKQSAFRKHAASVNCINTSQIYISALLFAATAVWQWIVIYALRKAYTFN